MALLGCLHALTSVCFFGHLSATLFSNDRSLLPNKGALPPLRADPVHLSEISFHTRALAFFNLVCGVLDKESTATLNSVFVRWRTKLVWRTNFDPPTFPFISHVYQYSMYKTLVPTETLAFRNTPIPVLSLVGVCGVSYRSRRIKKAVCG